MTHTSITPATPWVRPDTFVEGFHDEAVVRRMPYRHLPNVGLVSVLGFGGGGLGGLYTSGEGSGVVDAPSAPQAAGVWWAEDPASEAATARTVLLEYLKAGGNIIDTAPWYGQGKSERLIGRALEGVPRRAYYLMTKVGRYERDPVRMFDFTAATVMRSVRDSLKRLRVAYVDVIQVHDAEYAPDLTAQKTSNIIVEAVSTLHGACRAGLARRVGLTGYPVDTLSALLKQCHAAGVPVHTSLSYCRYALNDRTLHASGYWEATQRLGVGVVNASPISMGLLTKAGPPAWHPATAEARAACRAAVAYCEERGVDVSRLALKFALRGRAATTLVSVTDAGLMRANVRTATEEALGAQEEGALEGMVREIFGPAGNLSWEGVELEVFWKTLSKEVVMQKYKAAAAPRL